MGDRSNIVVEQFAGTRVYLYGHWMGESAISVVGSVLSRQRRWDDESYLARMIFSAMVKNDIGGETGYGISTYLVDNEYPIIVLSPGNRLAWIEQRYDNYDEATLLTPKVTMAEMSDACQKFETFDDLISYLNRGSKSAIVEGAELTTAKSKVHGVIKNIIPNKTGSYRVLLDVDGEERWTTVKI